MMSHVPVLPCATTNPRPKKNNSTLARGLVTSYPIRSAPSGSGTITAPEEPRRFIVKVVAVHGRNCVPRIEMLCILRYGRGTLCIAGIGVVARECASKVPSINAVGLINCSLMIYRSIGVIAPLVRQSSKRISILNVYGTAIGDTVR
ncbi:unnamed protein product [Ectocarpus sp. 4 AP-2014]